MTDKDEIISNLKWRLNNAENRIKELEKENKQLYSKLDHADYKIKTELEPRISEQKRNYDLWVLSPERNGYED